MSVRINDIIFPAEYMTSPEEIMKGMMGRESLDGCMVFKMGIGHHSFWMKNCLIPLDILFINNDKIIKIHHNCPPCKTNDCIHYEGNGNMVLEIYGGSCKKYNIKEGDIIQLNL